MPMATLYNPETDRSMSSNKFKIHKVKSNIEDEAYNVCREGKFRKIVLR